MKKILITGFLALLGLVWFSCASQQINNGKDADKNPQTRGKRIQRGLSVNRIAGTWTFENPDYEGMQLIFGEDNTVTMINDSFKTIGTYVIKLQFDPVQLDIIWPDLGTVQTIIRFIDDNKIQIENSDLEMERPEFFTDNSELLIRMK